MKLPNWFRILWWVVLVGIPTTFVWLRHMDTAGWNLDRHVPGSSLSVVLRNGD
jgi:hypothetical protein